MAARAATVARLISCRQTEIPMSTATRGAALIADDPLDAPGSTASTGSGAASPARSSAHAASSAPGDTVASGTPSPSAGTSAGATLDAQTHAELTAMLGHALRMLPRAALGPVVAASCPWFQALPPAAARQCLAAVEAARSDTGSVEAILAQWRERARPFTD